MARSRNRINHIGKLGNKCNRSNNIVVTGSPGK